MFPPLQMGSLAPASSGVVVPVNDEGVTALMASAKSGSTEIFQAALADVRAELGNDNRDVRTCSALIFVLHRCFRTIV